MAWTLAGRILDRLDRLAQDYHQLLLLVAPAGSGKTAALTEVRDRLGAPLVNLNLALSGRLLDLTGRERALSLSTILEEILRSENGDPVLLDNIELIFDPALQQDPLRLLQRLSRNRRVVAAWPGEVQEGYVTYAESGHPEHRRYPAKEVVTLSLEYT